MKVIHFDNLQNAYLKKIKGKCLYISALLYIIYKPPP